MVAGMMTKGAVSESWCVGRLTAASPLALQTAEILASELGLGRSQIGEHYKDGLVCLVVSKNIQAGWRFGFFHATPKSGPRIPYNRLASLSISGDGTCVERYWTSSGMLIEWSCPGLLLGCLQCDKLVPSLRLAKFCYPKWLSASNAGVCKTRGAG
eukprot:1148631-Pelagomonas_calceolata.AAC.4